MTKRLTNDELEAFIEGVSGRFISIGGDAALAVLNEVKERRAADLTPGERDAFRCVLVRLDRITESGLLDDPEASIVAATIRRLLGDSK